MVALLLSHHPRSLRAREARQERGTVGLSLSLRSLCLWNPYGCSPVVEILTDEERDLQSDRRE